MLENTELTSFIMDAEVVAIDKIDGSVKSFQELASRSRKDVKLEDVKVQVCLFAFDLMYLNDKVSALISPSFCLYNCTTDIIGTAVSSKTRPPSD